MRAFKMEVRAAHSRLNEVTAAKERAEVALQQELHQEQQRRRESEIAHKDLQDRFTKDFGSLRGRISEKDQTLKSRDGEIKLLAAQIATLNEQLHKAESAKDRAAVSLQDQLRKEQEIRHASDSVIRTLEDGFKAKISALEKQVAEKQEAAANPDTVELDELRAELRAVNQRMSEMVAAKDNVESLFRDALREKAELLQSTEIGRKDLEEDFADKLRIRENQLREKTDVIQNQAADLLAAKKQLADLSTEKDQGIRSLQATVQQQAELLQSKETVRQALESRSGEAIRSLEGQLNERDEMLASRDAEVKAQRCQSRQTHGAIGRVGPRQRSRRASAARRNQTKDRAIARQGIGDQENRGTLERSNSRP